MNLSKKLALIPLTLSLLFSPFAQAVQHVDKAYLDNVT